MKYALVDGERSEAKPGLTGFCPGCSSPLIAKCGEVKVFHWAHKGKRMCDPWWENETEWHRAWKGHFPEECQEIIQHAPDGEKHIADVKTSQGWVLEFQHSPIKPEERRARNAFYKKLVWVVDGTRGVRNKTNFVKILNQPNLVSLKGKLITPHTRRVRLEDCALLREWSGISSPVFFDFGVQILWCLLPVCQDGWGYLIEFPRNQFITLNNQTKSQNDNFLKLLNQLNEIALLVSKHQGSARNNIRIPDLI